MAMVLYIFLFIFSGSIDSSSIFATTSIIDSLILDQTNQNLINNQYLCGSTSSLDTLNTGILSYPADVFQIDNLNQLTNKKTYNCSSVEFPITFHQCSISGDLCPVSKQNLISFLNVTKWNINPNICKIFDNPNLIYEYKAEPMIYILGGSVTIGRFTQGCCCDLETSCPKHNVNQKCVHYFPQTQVDAECGWMQFFMKFIAKKYPYISTKSLAHGGTTSPFIFLSEVDDIFKIKYKSNDIIFIDYSVNDQKELFHDLKLVEFGLEGLIRHFLKHNSSVIILESNPQTGKRMGLSNGSNNFMKPNSETVGYFIPYRKLAEYYSLPIWSYHDMVWNDYVDTKQLKYSEYIRWNKVNSLRYEHPHWFAHLFLADLVSASWITLNQSCYMSLTDQNLKNEIFTQNSYNSNNLPKAIAITFDQGCNKNSEVPIHVEAINEYNKIINNSAINTQYFKMFNKNQFNISYLSHYLKSDDKLVPYMYGWHLYEESKGKPGWISTGFSQITNQTHENLIHFTLNMTNYIKERNKLVLKLSFLRTYKNAGIIDVFMCEKLIGTIDSLWDNDNHFSVSQIAYLAICNYGCHKIENELIITIKRRYVNNQLIKRENQKFKILSISACVMKDQCAFETDNKLRIYG